MKNRLQIRYFMPAKFPFTREEAVTYIKDIFETDKSEKTRICSLPGEPIAVFYNSTDETDQYKALRTSNVILAIGRGGDGENLVNNEPYFLIDSAKLEEDIKFLKAKAESVDNIIAQFSKDISILYGKTEQNELQIELIWKKIGTKVDGINADTVYGYINNRYETIVGGKEIPTKATLIDLNNRLNTLGGLFTQMRNNIDVLTEDLNVERVNRQNADAELDNKITAETDNRVKADTVLNDKINEEYSRAAGKEAELSAAIDAEAALRENADIVLKNYVDSETSRATKAESDLMSAVIAEETRAEKVEAELENLIEDEIERAEREERTIKESLVNTENRLNTKIVEEVTRLTAKDTELTTRFDAIQATNNQLNNELTKANAAISAEASTRQSEDEKLQRSINDNTALINKNRVVSNGKTVLVTQPNDNGTNLEVNVDNKTIVIDAQTGSLRVSSDALVQYKGEAAVVVSEVHGESKTISLKINPNDKVLTNEDTGLLVNLSLNWNNGKTIQLLGKGGIIISEVPVDSFIKDGMIDDVYLDQKNPDYPELVFVFNTSAGKQEIRVPVKDLLYQYSAGKGLELVNSTFNIKIDDTSEVYLSVTDNGLKLSGITSLVNTVKDEVTAAYVAADDRIKADFAAADAAIYAKYDPALENLERAYKDADNAVRADFTAADANLRAETTKLFESTNSSLASEISSRTEADANLQKQLDTVVASVSTEKEDRIKADENTLTSAKAYSDANKTEVNGKIALETSQREAKDNELAQNISDAETRLTDKINVLNGDTTVDGSVKSTVFNSVVGKVVTNILPENATEQTLLRKVMVEGQPMFYSSNDTQDMVHKGEQLSTIIDKVMEQSPNNDKLLELEMKILEYEKRLAYFESDEFIQKIKQSVISSETFKAVPNETKVDIVEGESITFGFADDAIFKAGN